MAVPVLYTNVETAVLRYIADVDDTTKFSPSFTACLARLLASYLAGPIIKGETGANVGAAQLKLFAGEYATATKLNANVGKRDAYQTRLPDWIAARGPSRICR
jgi:hypothetical protein